MLRVKELLKQTEFHRRDYICPRTSKNRQKVRKSRNAHMGHSLYLNIWRRCRRLQHRNVGASAHSRKCGEKTP